MNPHFFTAPFFYRQTRSRNWLSSLNYGKI